MPSPPLSLLKLLRTVDPDPRSKPWPLFCEEMQRSATEPFEQLMPVSVLLYAAQSIAVLRDPSVMPLVAFARAEQFLMTTEKPVENPTAPWAKPLATIFSECPPIIS